MNELEQFVERINQISMGESTLSVEQARKIVEELNGFLFATHDGLGSVRCLGQDFPYFSDFHKYWYEHHEEVLDIQVNDYFCEKVADALHSVFLQTGGRAFSEVYNTYGMTPEEICKIRLLTANQDFNGSRNFADLVECYRNNPDAFDIRSINQDPDAFIKMISVTKLSQTDKRANFARKITQFLLEHGTEPYDIIDVFNRDVFEFRNALISYDGAGYGNKKTDMFIRDMIVLGVWQNVSGFEKIDVASDVNTIKIALKTGILSCSMPLVSSFMDIFSYQYGLVDEMSAKAWRRVWELWTLKYPNERIDSPCLLDYFVYNVLGRQFCKDKLCIFECENGHRYPNNGARSKYCPICQTTQHKKVNTTLISRSLPCESDDGSVVIEASSFAELGICTPPMKQCPFKEICDECGNKKLMPPKSISILGQTGWDSAYSERGTGGGGLMA